MEPGSPPRLGEGGRCRLCAEAFWLSGRGALARRHRDTRDRQEEALGRAREARSGSPRSGSNQQALGPARQRRHQPRSSGMIRKQDIIDRAAEWQLRPDVVEKDYALGWLLASIAGHPETATRWVFKGGTCLKKCFISELLLLRRPRFLCSSPAQPTPETWTLDAAPGARSPSECAQWHRLRRLRSLRARAQGQAREADVPGKGRLQGTARGARLATRILLDITQHEPIVSDAVNRPIRSSLPRMSCQRMLSS